MQNKIIGPNTLFLKIGPINLTKMMVLLTLHQIVRIITQEVKVEKQQYPISILQSARGNHLHIQISFLKTSVLISAVVQVKQKTKKWTVVVLTLHNHLYKHLKIS